MPEEEENEPPLMLKLVGRTFWMGAATYSFHKISSYDLYRPLIWPFAKLSYLLLILLAIASSLYLRLRVGPAVPRYRWRMYIPVPIYLMTFLHVASFILMLLAFGFSLKNVLMMMAVNTGILSFLSFL